ITHKKVTSAFNVDIFYLGDEAAKVAKRLALWLYRHFLFDTFNACKGLQKCDGDHLKECEKYRVTSIKNKTLDDKIFSDYHNPEAIREEEEKAAKAAATIETEVTLKKAD
ncbi:hypothetical protein Tco_0912698, partial [Tanacetum coccineum]